MGQPSHSGKAAVTGTTSSASTATSSKGGSGVKPIVNSNTCPYAIAHILANLTTTNTELRRIALSEKDITEEQYEKLQHLQNMHSKDKDGANQDFTVSSRCGFVYWEIS
jgi:hypothetical protein